MGERWLALMALAVAQRGTRDCRLTLPHRSRPRRRKPPQERQVVWAWIPSPGQRGTARVDAGDGRRPACTAPLPRLRYAHARSGARTVLTSSRAAHGRLPAPPFRERVRRHPLPLGLERPGLLPEPALCAAPQRRGPDGSGKASDGGSARARAAQLPPGAAIPQK
jgi:hypothetical protein